MTRYFEWLDTTTLSVFTLAVLDDTRCCEVVDFLLASWIARPSQLRMENDRAMKFSPVRMSNPAAKFSNPGIPRKYRSDLDGVALALVSTFTPQIY